MASKAVLLTELRELLDSMDSPEEQDLQNKAIDNLPEKFRHAFRKLADHMEVDDMEFLAYWETDERCQKVFRELTQRRVNIVEKMAGIMRELIA